MSALSPIAVAAFLMAISALTLQLAIYLNRPRPQKVSNRHHAWGVLVFSEPSVVPGEAIHWAEFATPTGNVYVYMSDRVAMLLRDELARATKAVS